MSVLEEPPQERHPIQTFVMEEDEEMIREAIYREIGRGGQVFFLSNRVQNIEQQMLRIQKMVPEARVSFAHGQMAERELENVMMEFVEGAIDILVCTTITRRVWSFLCQHDSHCGCGYHGIGSSCISCAGALDVPIGWPMRISCIVKERYCRK